MDWEERWEAIQETLYQATRRQLARFAAEHAGEPINGFAFDCNADYGEVLLCVNTEANLIATGHERWSLGDWKYHAFNLDGAAEEEWQNAWEELRDSISEAGFDDDEIPVRL